MHKFIRAHANINVKFKLFSCRFPRYISRVEVLCFKKKKLGGITKLKVDDGWKYVCDEAPVRPSRENCLVYSFG